MGSGPGGNPLAFARGTSSNGNATVTAVAVGGNGAFPQQVNLSNAVAGIAAGALTLEQRAQGGNAVGSGKGADGTSSLDESAYGKGTSLHAISNAFGGAGAGGQGGGQANATASAGGGLPALMAETHAMGGAGSAAGIGMGPGNGGYAWSDAQVNPSAGVQTASASGSAVGGAGGNTAAPDYAFYGGTGGGGYSRSSVYGDNQSVVVSDHATGGAGGAAGTAGSFARIYGGAGGSATSAAQGWNTSDLPVNVSAVAQGGAGGAGIGPGATGGQGGNASLERVHGQSATGDVTVSGTAIGGDSGAPSDGATGGIGGSVYLENAVSGSTEGALELHQTAIGGNGSSTGLGGDASSYLSVSDSQAAALGGFVTATGGGGGNGGGQAHAHVNLAGLSVVRASATAIAGPEAAAYATANATSSGGTGAATARIQTQDPTGVRGANSQYVAQMQDAGSGLTATAWGDLGGASSATGVAAEGVAAPTLGSGAGLQEFGFITAHPITSDVADVTAKSPAVASAFAGKNPLAIVALGGGGAMGMFTTGVTLNGGPAGSDHLLLGLCDVTSTGAGFGQITVEINNGGVSLFNETFMSLSDAEAALSNQVVDLGQVSSVGLTANLTISTWDPGDSFGMDFVLSDPTVGAVPEPATLGMMGAGMMVLMSRRRRQVRV